MTLRLSGDTSGFTEIKAADAAGDNSIKLPAANGSANQLLQNGGTAGELQYTSANGGLHYDSDGRLLLGRSSAPNNDGALVIQGYAGVTAGEGTIHLLRGNNVTTTTQGLGSIDFGHDQHLGASIDAVSEAAWTEGLSHPTRLTFCTTATGSDAPTARVEIANSGELKLLAGCPGIDFSTIQPAAIAGTMTSETLASYEEGLFEPIAYGASSVGTTSYSLQFGAYVKIGKICHFQIRMQVTSMTGSGTLIIGGLPFTSMNDAQRGYASINVSYYSALTAAAGVTHIGAYTERNATHMVLVGNTVGAVVTTPQVDTDWVMLCGGTYRTDS